MQNQERFDEQNVEHLITDNFQEEKQFEEQNYQNVDDVQLDEDVNYQDDDQDQRSNKMVEKIANIIANQEQLEVRNQIKKPISAYIIFVSNWKQKHPGQKMEIALMGKIWNQLSPQQKSIYVEEYRNQKAKYAEYMLQNQINNLTVNKPNPSAGFLFPLSRVKCILKQDLSYQAKNQAVSATSKAAQFFGQYLLDQIKKMTEGKSRITSQDLYECIRVKNRVLGFLDCVIDESNHQKLSFQQKEAKEAKIVQQSIKKKIQPIKKQPANQNKIHSSKNMKIPSNQIRLTDMFPKKE